MERVINIIIIMFVCYSVAGSAWRHRKEFDFVWSVWKRFRIKMLIEVLLLLVVLIGGLIFLMIRIPFLQWGWWALFSADNVGGNILVAPFLEVADTGHTIAAVAVLVFFFLVFLLLPFLAKIEEIVFRSGYNDWRSVIRMSIIFGLAHLTMGVPIAVGIGLILPGLFFGYKYKQAYEKERARLSIPDGYWAHIDRGEMSMEEYSRREQQAEDEAVLVSTTYHTMYNSLIFLLIFFVLIFPPA